ncbi:hypothetical protein LINPERPRIM_LOCUS23190 [Linum perenne]
MAMLQMQADMQQQQQQYSYFSGHYLTRDPELSGDNTNIWPSRSGNNNLVWPPRSSGDSNVVWPPRSSVDGNVIWPPRSSVDGNVVWPPRSSVDGNVVWPPRSSIDGNVVWPPRNVNDNVVLPPRSVVEDNVVWPPRSVVDDNVARNGQKPYNCFPELPSTNQHSAYQEMVRQTMLQQEAMSNQRMVLQSPNNEHLVFKEMVKQTMLQQESVFKDQVHSLHCLYDRQREMLNQMRSMQLNTHHPQLEMLQSNPMLSQFSCERQKTYPVAPMPWLTCAASQSSVSAVRNNLIDLNHSDGDASTGVCNPVQAQDHANEPLVLESKFKRYGKKILDLERPAEEYIDGEEGLHLVVEAEGLLKESSGGFLKSNTESSFGIMDLNLEYQEGEMFQALPVKSECLADLNEPAQLEDETRPASDILKQPLELAADGSSDNENTASVGLKPSVDVVNGDRESCMGISDLNCTRLEDNVFEDSKCGQSHELADLSEPSKYEEDTDPKSSAFIGSNPGQVFVDQLVKVDSNLQDNQPEVSDKEGSNESCSSALEVDQSETEDELEELPSNNDRAGENSRDSNSLSGEMTSTLSENTEQVEQVPLARTVVRRSGRLRWERLGSLLTASGHTSAKRNRNRNRCMMTFPEIVQALPCDKSHLYSGEMTKPRQRAINVAKPGCDKIIKHRRKRKLTCHSNASTDHEFEEEHGGSRKSIKVDINPSDSQDLHSMLTENEPNGKALPSLCINMNPCTNEDESASTPSSLSREVHLVAPQGGESMETSQLRGDLKENLLQTTVKSSGEEDVDVDVLMAPVRAAAEVLVFISSQVPAVPACTEGVMFSSSEILNVQSLYCLASVAASVTDDLEADYGLSLSRDGAGLTSDETDYFEAMTLKLPEIEEEEYHCSNVKNQLEGKPFLANSPIQEPRKGGTTRRGKLQKRDFQSEILPSLVSLSRYEVTEDLQVIGNIPTVARSRSNTSLRKAIRNEQTMFPAMGKKRQKKRASESAPNLINRTSCLMELGSSTVEEGWTIDWGKVTRRRRGQRCRVSLLGLTFATRYGQWMN